MGNLPQRYGHYGPHGNPYLSPNPGYVKYDEAAGVGYPPPHVPLPPAPYPPRGPPRPLSDPYASGRYLPGPAGTLFDRKRNRILAPDRLTAQILDAQDGIADGHYHGVKIKTRRHRRWSEPTVGYPPPYLPPPPLGYTRPAPPPPRPPPAAAAPYEPSWDLRGAYEEYDYRDGPVGYEPPPLYASGRGAGSMSGYLAGPRTGTVAPRRRTLTPTLGGGWDGNDNCTDVPVRRPFFDGPMGYPPPPPRYVPPSASGYIADDRTRPVGWHDDDDEGGGGPGLAYDQRPESARGHPYRYALRRPPTDLPRPPPYRQLYGSDTDA